MVAVLVVIMIIGGLSGTMLMQAMGGQRSTSRSVEASKLLFVSEAGLDYNFVKMSQDPLYAVTNLAFQLDGADQSYVSPTLTLDAGATQQSFQYRIQYLLAETPVVFADRSDPIEPFEEVKVICTATGPFATREIASWYGFEAGNVIQGAIVSDMTPTRNRHRIRNRPRVEAIPNRRIVCTVGELWLGAVARVWSFIPLTCCRRCAANQICG